MNTLIVFTLGFTSSLISILILAKVKLYLYNKQQSKLKLLYGDVIEFTYQNKDGVKTTFIVDGNNLKVKKE